MSLTSNAFLLFLFVLTVVIKRRLDKNHLDENPRDLGYPPGPKKLPLIGNVFDIPSRTPWITYTRWAKTYSDILHLRALGQHVVVLCSVKAATDLLDKRSSIYSDRPYLPIWSLMGWDFDLAGAQYSPSWRTHRRMFQQKFRPVPVMNLRPKLLEGARSLLRDLLLSPDDFMDHARNFTASVIMKIVWHDITPEESRIANLAEEAGFLLTQNMKPGAWLVNVFPLLRYLPEWLPGGGFHRVARVSRAMTSELLNVPFDMVKTKMAQGRAMPCWTAELLKENISAESEEGNKSVLDEEIIKAITLTTLTAGTRTTTATLQIFFLAMVLYPEVQSQAQEAIDHVVYDRLPEFEDWSSLPYIQALYLELLRWRPVACLGVAHCSTEHDVYRGYFIPKDTIVMPNVWAMTHDEDIYREPNTFKPERFLTADGELKDDDDMGIAFGFGPRVCVGRHFAESMLWIGITSILSAFRIDKARDVTGIEIPVEERYTDGLINNPLPFRCCITPRSQEARRRILESLASPKL